MVKCTHRQDSNIKCRTIDKSIGMISKWSKIITETQENERINDILDNCEDEKKNNLRLVDKYYKIAAKPIHGKYSCGPSLTYGY